MTLARFVVCVGLYTELETVIPLYIDGLIAVDKPTLFVFSLVLVHAPWDDTLSKGRILAIIDPL
ncbi:hypothetical protein Hanom_Chr10g00878811 [Helianthus anomalus]